MGGRTGSTPGLGLASARARQPIGMQITDNELEQRLRQRSEIAGLFMGVFLAVFAQIGYELVRGLAAARSETPRS